MKQNNKKHLSAFICIENVCFKLPEKVELEVHIWKPSFLLHCHKDNIPYSRKTFRPKDRA